MKICLKCQVDILYKKIVIFEIKNHPDIKKNSDNKNGFSDSGAGFGHDLREHEVCDNAGYDQKQIVFIKIAIEPQGHSKEIPQPKSGMNPVQKIVSDHTDRKKEHDK